MESVEGPDFINVVLTFTPEHKQACADYVNKTMELAVQESLGKAVLDFKSNLKVAVEEEISTQFENGEFSSTIGDAISEYISEAGISDYIEDNSDISSVISSYVENNIDSMIDEDMITEKMEEVVNNYLDSKQGLAVIKTALTKMIDRLFAELA